MNAATRAGQSCSKSCWLRDSGGTMITPGHIPTYSPTCMGVQPQEHALSHWWGICSMASCAVVGATLQNTGQTRNTHAIIITRCHLQFLPQTVPAVEDVFLLV